MNNNWLGENIYVAAWAHKACGEAYVGDKFYYLCIYLYWLAP